MRIVGTVRRHFLARSSSFIKANFIATIHNPSYSSSNRSMSSNTDQVSRDSRRGIIEEELRKLPHLPVLGNPIRTLRASIHDHKNKKWGFLVYRCDYSSDEDWTRFLWILQTRVKEELQCLQATGLLSPFEMTAKEDKDILNGASVDKVREHFWAWVNSDEAEEELRDAPYGPFRYARYTYCVYVDAGVIDSVVKRALQPPKHDYSNEIGYVNLVRLRMEDMIPDNSVSAGDPEDEVEEEDEEDMRDENFVKVPLRYICPEIYGDLDWYTFDQMGRFRRRKDGVSWARSGKPLDED